MVVGVVAYPVHRVGSKASHLLCRLYGPKRFGTKPRWARRWAVIDAAQGFLLRGHIIFPCNGRRDYSRSHASLHLATFLGRSRTFLIDLLSPNLSLYDVDRCHLHLGGHRYLSLATRSLAFKLRTPSATDLVVRIYAAAQGYLQSRLGY